MSNHGSLKFRILVDFLLVAAFGFAAPLILEPLSRSRGTLLTSMITFLLAFVFLWDGLRAVGRLRKPHSS